VIEAYGTAETEFRRTSTAYDVVDRTVTVTAPLDGAAWWTVSEYDELGLKPPGRTTRGEMERG
jgi:hypothetical protein